MVRDDLSKCAANYSPLSPITFLERAAKVYPDRDSIIYGDIRFTWKETLMRCRSLASAMRANLICAGDTVAVVAPNVPASYELHFAVPMAGAALNAINMRLNAESISFILHHSEAKMIFVDTEFLPLVEEAVRLRSVRHKGAGKIVIVQVADRSDDGEVDSKFPEYEDFMREGNPEHKPLWPIDEWDAIAINYTSGTTALPKGVVYHHRGAYLASLAVALDWGLPTGAVYLWTLPMFHANGWCFTWIMAAQGGTNICLRKVTAKSIFENLSRHNVTHMCGAPVILEMIANAEPDEKKPLSSKVHFMAAGAPPPATLLAKVETQGFFVTHGYGLTEIYGATWSCVWKDEWNSLPLEEQAAIKARQGVGNLGITARTILDVKTRAALPHDGVSMGEVVVKGHAVMKGYLKDDRANENAFFGGWFHTGDLGVIDPDGYLRLKDRSKDLIISGGENISSIEVESALYKHPQVLEAAVVARPDEQWGETPCAFVTLTASGSVGSKPNQVSEADLIAHCRSHLPSFKIPRTIVFDSLPKTATGKIQKNVLRERASQLVSKPHRRSKM